MSKTQANEYCKVLAASLPRGYAHNCSSFVAWLRSLLQLFLSKAGPTKTPTLVFGGDLTSFGQGDLDFSCLEPPRKEWHGVFLGKLLGSVGCW